MTKVVVAMSGGVDSSVAAHLLKEQGYEVTGLMLRLWSEPGKENSNRCCTPDSVAQAKKVASILDIPFYVIDAKDIFYDKVVRYFIDGYADGITPNPCLACNRHIRFDLLFNHAMALGADFMATGHYVQKFVRDDGMHLLRRAIDEGKDQSYVLHVIKQDILRKVLFPVGEHPKSIIREIAGKIGLPVAKRPDSQDLCFLAGEDYRTFLQRYEQSSNLPGNIISTNHQVLGTHTGLHNYTIGQRKGLGITTIDPYFVVKKDYQTNSLVVGDARSLGTDRLIATEVEWSCGSPPSLEFDALVKTRYTSKPAAARIKMSNENASEVMIQFYDLQRDITPGQAAVIYDSDVMLGGGIILSTDRSELP